MPVRRTFALIGGAQTDRAEIPNIAQRGALVAFKSRESTPDALARTHGRLTPSKSVIVPPISTTRRVNRHGSGQGSVALDPANLWGAASAMRKQLRKPAHGDASTSTSNIPERLSP